MHHIEILLPYALPPAEFINDITKQIDAPAFSGILFRTSPKNVIIADHVFDDINFSLPHEVWLANQFGLGKNLTQSGSPPSTISVMQSFGLDASVGTWFMLHPSHLHITRTQLILTDYRQLQLSIEESKALFSISKNIFDAANIQLHWGSADTWFIRADNWHALRTATPDAAFGHSIDKYYPIGMGEKEWQKILNEIQMSWHDHPINQARQSHGQKIINSLWLYAGTHADTQTIQSTYTATVNLPAWMGTLHHTVNMTPDAFFKNLPKYSLVVLDDLIAPALSNDWGQWLENLRTLDVQWFTPLFEQLHQQNISAISIVMTDHQRIHRFHTNNAFFPHFWRKPSLKKLLS